MGRHHGGQGAGPRIQRRMSFQSCRGIILQQEAPAQAIRRVHRWQAAPHQNFHAGPNFEIIGSAHNIKELNIKLLQGCSDIIFPRLFKVAHPLKKGFLGIIKFNLFKLSRKENLVPLGGINISNLTKLKMVRSNSFALLSEIKKKPAKIINRLF